MTVTVGTPLSSVTDGRGDNYLYGSFFVEDNSQAVRTVLGGRHCRYCSKEVGIKRRRHASQYP